ncbi:HAMP domain-containing protein [Leptolyngbya cf. ectocarpi LEGE 11479]|uniref:HAMP domain-containing protein n=1 Tax=Leptolyngbya cf. ectocarpi LEGE 11479 TaxID=1828722 RepID=A0A929F977_LEPEC|nr:adenylate/guanylate cyclase domain-containing protein [Leptolyngbya ectocarpi]MBE9067419.1 HAMP domain-containing protein [Leptolyngbya cf. ectocarpi LEGE 11479]
MLNRLRIKSKLMALLVGVSLGSLVVGGTLSWLRFRQAFQRQVFDHLTSVRASKGAQIESYIKGFQDWLELLSEDRTVISAMVEFNAAYRSLQNEEIPNEWIEAIETYYGRDFLPDLAENVEGPQIVANYRPLSQASQYLQYHYLVGNAPSNEGDGASSTDDSTYAQHHATYHQTFKNLIDQYGYSDLYLIDFNNGEIVYSVNKRPDFATSLDRGPYRRSGLSDIVAAVRDNPGRGFVQVVDFKPYVPNVAAPVAFLATPIFNGPHIVGILALQMPPDRLNAILVGTQEWEEEGLGETGQVYVVGEDALMRSQSRELIEDADTYRETLRNIGLSSQTVDLVYNLNTSVLLQPVDTEATQAAMAGETDTKIIQDYQGKSVLSAYAPLKLEGLRWAILAEMDRSEALGPITMMQIYMGTLAVIITLVAALLAGLVAQAFARPVRRLIKASEQLQTGESTLDVSVEGSDEFAQLGASFQTLSQKIKDQNQLLKQKELENETLLKNILPESIVTRFRQGEQPIANTIQQATVLVAKVLGLAQYSSSETTTTALSALISDFNKVAKQSGLEPQSMADETYLAVCGLSEVYFDHKQRGLNMAQEMLRIVQSVNSRYQVNLSIKIGLHAGSFVAGVVGTELFTYKLWGKTVAIATQLPEQAEPNQIVVTQPIYERLKDRHQLSAHGSVKADDMEMPTWHLVTDKVPVGSSV